jgi:hypothetical protein
MAEAAEEKKKRVSIKEKLANLIPDLNMLYLWFRESSKCLFCTPYLFIPQSDLMNYRDIYMTYLIKL